MRAVAVFPKTREIKLIDYQEPFVHSASEVKVQILEVGICGTDREIASFKYGTPPENSDFLVLGHESLGKVIETGKDVKKFKPGDYVVTSVRRPCLESDCKACRAGRPDFCLTGNFRERGIKELHGYMTDRIVDDEKYMTPVPRGLEKIAVLIEPLTIAEKSIREVWKIQERLPWMSPEARKNQSMQGFKAVVLGAGPVGLLGAMLLSLQGFRTFVYSIEEAGSRQAKIVESLGAAYLSVQDVPHSQLVEKTGNIDIIYEATGAAKLCFEVLPYLGTNGVFVFTGIPGRKSQVEVDESAIMKALVLKNQVIFGSVNAGPDAFQSAVGDLGRFHERWPGAVESLITARCPIEKALPLLQSKAGGIKHVVSLG